MGEAKRRKALDNTFGQPKLRCFISNATLSDGHAIWLEKDKNKQKEYKVVSVFKDIEKAGVELRCCNLILSKVSSWGSIEELTQKICTLIISTFGMMEDDDVSYQIQPQNGKLDINKIIEQIHSGEVQAISPLIKKKYKPVATMGAVTDELWFVGNTEDLTIPASADKSLGLFSYFTAAYIADYMNDNDLLQIQPDEMRGLYTKANKVRERIEKLSESELKEIIKSLGQGGDIKSILTKDFQPA